MTDPFYRISRNHDFDLSSELHSERTLARLQAQTRRHFLRSMTGGLGAMFLGTLASPFSSASAEELATGDSVRLDLRRDPKTPLTVLPPQFAPHAKRVIYLRSEEHTSELQSHSDLVCRLLLEKKKNHNNGYQQDSSDRELHHV